MRTMVLVAILAVLGLFAGCRCACGPMPPPAASDASGLSDGPGIPTLAIANRTTASATVYIAFGADSVIKGWPMCTPNPSGCSFPLAAGASQGLPLAGKYLNATMAFNANVGCNATKAEVNIGNPAWSQDTADVSMVDGYSNNIEIDLSGSSLDGGALKLGPPLGKTGNEKVYGLFPYGCDICTARQSPPCGIAAGGTGCKAGTQYNPAVPCQWSGARGTTYVVALTP